MKKNNIQNRMLLEVIQQYGWKPVSVKNVGSVWKVECDDRIYALKRSRASREKLLLLGDILSKVQTHFLHVLPWIKAKDGKRVVTSEGASWYATPWKEEKEAKEISTIQLMEALGGFHYHSKACISPYPELRMPFTERDVEDWKVSGNKLNQYKERIDKREFYSPLEKQFARNKDMMERVVHFSSSGMEKFLGLENGTPPRYTLCHKRFSPRHVVQDKDNFYFISFDHVQVESPVRDIASCMKRLVNLEDSEHPFDLLEAYEKKNKLLPIEKKLLALHLAYPERVFRLMDRYYENKTSTDELVYLRRFEKELGKLEHFEEMIKYLWNTRKEKEKPPQQLKVASKKKKQVKA